MSARPKDRAEWVSALRRSPSRQPYSDEELIELRVTYDPEGPLVVSAREAVVIWTLLDMLEAERDWG